MPKRPKKILVTGATGSLGGAISKALASEGVQLALQYHKASAKAEALKGELAVLGAEVGLFSADLCESGAAARLVREAVKFLGGVDLFINAASVFERTPLGEVTEEQWERLLCVDLKAAFFIAQEVGLMMQRDGGKMIFLSDVAAVKPYAGYLPYCIAKAGVDAIVRGLAKSLAPKVQVNAVAPYVVTRPPGLSDKGWNDILSKTPMQRPSTADEIAAIVKMLAFSGESITGQVISVDGGRLLR